ncbi:hypothetical protein SDC9_194151 [bioreactor metagenome]|uniref:Uncharacterized protein n=1 Tax=bioreactor metagenome TaxID=1076179 RepID=A0A645I5I3_9ZZZZ
MPMMKTDTPMVDSTTSFILSGNPFLKNNPTTVPPTMARQLTIVPNPNIFSSVLFKEYIFLTAKQAPTEGADKRQPADWPL